jgi:hypothetical protein
MFPLQKRNIDFEVLSTDYLNIAFTGPNNFVHIRGSDSVLSGRDLLLVSAGQIHLLGVTHIPESL